MKIKAAQEQALADKQQLKTRPQDEEKQELLDVKRGKDNEV
jgi:hypothetical protein